MRNITKTLLESLNNNEANDNKLVKFYEEVYDWNIDFLGQLNDGRYFAVLSKCVFDKDYSSVQMFETPVQISTSKRASFERMTDASCHIESESAFESFMERYNFNDCDKELNDKILKELKQRRK